MFTCSIGVLSYNESKNLPLVIKGLATVANGLSDAVLKVVIINNGSTDDTMAVIKNIESDYNFVTHIDVPINLGYGYGVKAGLKALSGDVVGYMWGDNQFDPGVVKDLLSVFANDPNIKLVKTYRRKRFDGRQRKIVSGFYQNIFRWLYGGKVIDINSTPKLFRYDFLQKILPLQSDDWFIDAEIMIKSVRITAGYQIRELPIDFYPRQFGKSNVRISTCFEFMRNLLFFKFKKPTNL